MTAGLGWWNGQRGAGRRRSLLLGSLLCWVLAGLVLTPAWARAERTIAQGCDSSGGKCCIDAEGRRVPPGTRNGPYTCLPDGSWG